MSGLPDLYKVLQVDEEAEVEVIQAAYRRLARKYHPDASGDDPARMAALSEAWTVLRDPVRRAGYDAERGRRRPRAAPVATAETTSPHWTSGRSTSGSGYDPSQMRAPDGHGAAGPPPGRPSGSVVTFGRYAGWSLGEVARQDLEFLEWLDRVPIGRPYQAEIDALLRTAGRRRTAERDTQRRGLFRRR